jgi:formate dehydrogenase iron-sulfur subunit
MDSASQTIIKCDECSERVASGGIPACVSACPTKALQYKPLEEILEAKREAFLVQIERALSEAKT